MMLPVARAVLSSVQGSGEDQGSKLKLQHSAYPPFVIILYHIFLINHNDPKKGDLYRFTTAILLAVAYSASIGGLAYVSRKCR